MTDLLTAADSAAPLSKDQLVASSAGWLAVSLNLGCQGLGYIYQRRWRAFWLGGVVAMGSAVALGTGAFLFTRAMAIPVQLDGQEQRLDVPPIAAVFGAYGGVLAVGVGSAVEAGLAVKRSRRRLAGPGSQSL